MILPERLPRRDHTILLWNDDLRNSLPWVLLFIPDFPCIFNWLVLEILAQLHLEEVFGVVLGVEFGQPVAEDMV